MTWWQGDYVYRRKLSLFSPVDVPAGHGAHAVFSKVLSDNGKVRGDLEDIEVIYVDPDGVESPIYREVSEDDYGIYVSFNLQELLESGQDTVDKYYLYYGNLNLSNQVTRPSGDITAWALTTDMRDTEGFGEGGFGEGEFGDTSSVVTGPISYTRPGEHWKDGVSSHALARASLVSFVSDFRIVSEKDFDKSIMEVQVDGEDWSEVDLFARQNSIEPVFEELGLDASLHEIRIRVSGRKNVSALGDEVNIVRIEYNRPISIVDIGEEVDDLVWSSSVGGGG